MMCVMNRSQPRSVPNMKVKTVQPVSVISPVCYYSFDSNCFRSDWNSGFTETKDTHTHTPVMWSRYAMAKKSIILAHIFWRQHLPVNQISLSQKKTSCKNVVSWPVTDASATTRRPHLHPWPSHMHCFLYVYVPSNWMFNGPNKLESWRHINQQMDNLKWTSTNKMVLKKSASQGFDCNWNN